MALSAHELISTAMGVVDYAKAVFAFFGSPVNAISGAKVLMGNDDLDYQGIGHLPFYLQRLYSSQNDDTGWFGQGWKVQGLEQHLELDPQHDVIYLVDNSGRRVPFNYLAPDKVSYQAQEDITLYRLPLPKDKAHTQIAGQPILADAISGTRIGANEPFAFILLSGKVSLSTCQHLAKLSHTNSKNTKENTTTPTDGTNTEIAIDFDGIAQHFTKVVDRADNGTFAKVLLTKQSDKYHHKLQLHYTHTDTSKQHLPSFITDDAGNLYHLGFGLYDDKPRLNRLEQVHHIGETGIISQSTPLAQYCYDNEGNLIEVIIKGVTTRRFGYTNHLITHQWFITGQEGFYTYDQTHDAKTAKVIHHTLSTGEDYRFYYQTPSQDTNTSQDNAHQVYHTTTVVEQQGTKDERQFVYSYDDNFILQSYQNPHKHSTYFVYDGNDKLIRVFNDRGQEARFIYKQGKLTQGLLKVDTSQRSTKPIYRTWHYTYDQAGKLVALTNPKNDTITLAYTNKGELSCITDELGHQTHYAYDNDGNLIKHTLANQSHHSYAYDRLGNLTIHTDCSSYSTTYHYDDHQNPGRLTAITDAKGHTTRYGYILSKPYQRESF